MGFCTDDELREVADTGGSISSTPESELQMAMGHPVWARFLAAGGEPSLGVDIVSNHSGCLFSQMRLALSLARAFLPLSGHVAAAPQQTPAASQQAAAAPVSAAQAARTGAP